MNATVSGYGVSGSEPSARPAPPQIIISATFSGSGDRGRLLSGQPEPWRRSNGVISVPSFPPAQASPTAEGLSLIDNAGYPLGEGHPLTSPFVFVKNDELSR